MLPHLAKGLVPAVEDKQAKGGTSLRVGIIGFAGKECTVQLGALATKDLRTRPSHMRSYFGHADFLNVQKNAETGAEKRGQEEPMAVVNGFIKCLSGS